MTARDRSPVWIGLCDLALAMLSVVIVAVNPQAPKAGVEMKAELLVTVEWDVKTDADVDLHVMMPSGHPLFYGSRDVGCGILDRDNRGFMDSRIPQADGTVAEVMTNKETASIRCAEFGHYDIAVNLYEYRENHLSVGAKRGLALKAHVEIVQVNPVVKVLFARDVTLDRIGQTINVESFDMARDGQVALAEPPLESVTHAYQHGGYGAQP